MERWAFLHSKSIWPFFLWSSRITMDPFDFHVVIIWILLKILKCLSHLHFPISYFNAFFMPHPWRRLLLTYPAVVTSYQYKLLKPIIRWFSGGCGKKTTKISFWKICFLTATDKIRVYGHFSPRSFNMLITPLRGENLQNDK